MNKALEKSNLTQAEYFKDIVGTIREPLVVLDVSLRVLAANRSFYKYFKVNQKNTVGNEIYDLGNRQWDIPSLRVLLETILPEKAVFNDYEVEHDFPLIGKRNLLLNARRIPAPPKKATWILLAFEDVTERMELERSLQASEELFHRAFETAHDGMLLIEKKHGMIVNSNQMVEDALGYSKRSIKKKSLWELSILKDEKQFRQTALELEQQGMLRLPDITIPTKQGGQFPADVYLMDRAAVIQCNIHEISERKQAEEVVRKSEKRLRALLEHSNEEISLVDSDGTLTWESPNTIRPLGYPLNSFAGHNILDLFHPDERAIAARIIKQIRQHPGSTREGLFRLRHQDGSWRWMEGLLINLLDEPAVKSIVINYRDVTERKRTEEKLEEERILMRTLIDNLPDLVYAMDIHGRKILSNIADWRASGVKKMGDVIGKTDLDIYPPKLAKDYWALDKSVLDTGKPIFNLEESGLDPKGNPVVILSSKVPLRDSQGKVIGLVGIGHDITELRRTESENQSLLEILQGAATTENLHDLLELIHQSLAKVIYAENFFVVFKNKDSGLFEEVYSVDKYDPAMPPSKLEKSMISYVFRTGKSLLLTRAKFEELARRGEAELIGTQPAIWMGTPLKSHHETIGVIAVQNYEDPECYSERDKEFFASVSAEVAQAIERKRTGEALRESEEKYRRLVDDVNDGFYMTDDAGVFTFANPALARIYGFENPEALLGRKFMDFIAPELLAAMGESTRSTMHTGRAPEVINGQIVRLDGTRGFIEVKAVSILQGGQIVGSQGVVRDTTERMKAEEALIHEKNLLSALMDNIPDHIYFKDIDSRFIRMNQAKADRIGINNPVQAVGKTDFDFFTEQRARPAYENEQEIIRTGRPMVNFEETETFPDGRVATISTTKIPFRNPSGQTIGTIGISRDITERKQREDELKQRLAELVAVNKISTALRVAQTLDEMLPLLLDTTLEALQTTRGAIWIYDPVKNELRPALMRGWNQKTGGPPRPPEKPGEGVNGYAFTTGQPYIASDLQLDSHLQEAVRQWISPGIGGAAIPIRAGQTVIGTFEINTSLPRELKPQEIHLLTTVSEMAGNAIQRTTLREQTEHHLRQLTALSNIDRAISSTFDLHLSLGLLLEQVAKQLGIDATDILLFNPNSYALEFSSGRGFRTKAFEKGRLQIGEGYAGQAALRREIIHISNLTLQHDNPRLEKHLADEQFVSYYGLPLISKGEIKGVLEIFQRAPLEPDKEWLDFLGTLAGQAAIAIDSVMQFDNVQRSNLELTMAYDETIEGWSHALDLRDKETEGHTQRVTEMTQKLAHAFDINEANMVQVRWGALLHDIGKMGVPDTILLKPGPLTDEEWVLMKRHPTIAYELLAPIKYLKAALEIPYCHHEKWDGTGYPRGLKGEQIPLAARIFAVVDVWDALTSDRPYRKAWSEEKARQDIQAEAGTHFDPQVVKTFFLEYGKK